MSDALAGVTAALNLTHQLLRLAVVAKDAEAKLVIADLQIQLAELKTRLAELLEENAKLRQDAKTALTAKTEMIMKDGLYFKQDGDGPFCTACHDSKNQVIRVSELPKAFHMIAHWKCNVCGAKYGGNM